jgi:hypothetical protein
MTLRTPRAYLLGLLISGGLVCATVLVVHHRHGTPARIMRGVYEIDWSSLGVDHSYVSNVEDYGVWLSEEADFRPSLITSLELRGDSSFRCEISHLAHLTGGTGLFGTNPFSGEGLWSVEGSKLFLTLSALHGRRLLSGWRLAVCTITPSGILLDGIGCRGILRRKARKL